MSLRSRVLAAAAAGVMTALAVPASASTAVAEGSSPDSELSPAVCEAGTIYNTTATDTYIANPEKRVYGSGGGTLSFTRGESTTVSGSLQTTATAEAGAIFAKASASVSASIGLSKSVTSTVGYTYEVPSDVPSAYIEMGARGYDISWTKGYYQSPCTFVQTGSGSLTGATSTAFFTHVP